MSTAVEGTLERINPKQIAAKFSVNGKEMKFVADTDTEIKPFDAKPATLHYDIKEELEGAHAYCGCLGSDAFAFELDDGARFQGNFEGEGAGFSPEVDLSGVGEWDVGESDMGRF